MEAKECLLTRRSVRRFTEEVISHEKFEEIVEVAKWAPSWKNTQTLRYILVQDEDMIKKIADEAVLNFEYNAKTICQCKNLVLLAQVNGRCGYEKDGSFTTSKGTGWEMFDAGIAAQTFCLAAHEQGYGTVIQGIFDDKKIAEIVSLPEGQTITAVIPMGVPKFAVEATPRKEVVDIVSYR